MSSGKQRLVITLSVDVSGKNSGDIAAIACSLQDRIKPLRLDLGLRYDGDVVMIDEADIQVEYNDEPANPQIGRRS